MSVHEVGHQNGLRAKSWSILSDMSFLLIIFIFKEDNVFSMTAILPYGPPVNTDIDYYRTLFHSDFFFKCCDVSCAYLLGEYIMMSTKQGSHWYNFNAFGMAWPGFEPTISRSQSGRSTTEPAGPVHKYLFPCIELKTYCNLRPKTKVLEHFGNLLLV